MDFIISWPVYVQYLYAMYWALITAATIGYGDISPKNLIEVGYVIVFFAPNILFYSYMINLTFGQIQSNTDRANNTITKVGKVHYMLKHHKVDPRY
jgi:hypothetical protein